MSIQRSAQKLLGREGGGLGERAWARVKLRDPDPACRQVITELHAKSESGFASAADAAAAAPAVSHAFSRPPAAVFFRGSARRGPCRGPPMASLTVRIFRLEKMVSLTLACLV